MKTILLSLIISSLGFAQWGSFYAKKEKQLAQKAYGQIEQDLQTLEAFAEYSNSAIGAIIRKAAQDLRFKGSFQLARKLEKDWAQYNGVLVQMAQTHRGQMSMRDIGDFEPLNQWLSDAYEQIEASLGYTHCYSQRISDLKTINHGITVVFKPCEYEYAEFFKHFASDDPKYRSVLPVVSFWATLMGCYAGSYGTGFFMVCGGAAVMVESLVDQNLAPMLAPKIYEGACGSGRSAGR